MATLQTSMLQCRFRLYIESDSIPSTVTAGVNFQVIGQVEDGDNSSRNMTTAVALEMFWLDNPDEKLINGVFTAINGSFNLYSCY